MKLRTALLLLFLAAAAGLPAAETVAAGPQGGRLLAASPHPAEFFVTKERRVEITFYDAQRRAVPPGEHEVTVIAEPKSGRTPVALTKSDRGFVSTATLPAATEPYRVVVQIREKPGARPQNFRIDLNLEHCAGCDLTEYACTCAH